MNRSIPYMPRFEIVKVPPSRSDCCSFPPRARSTISCACGGDLGDRLPLASLDDRNDEPVRDRNGDADVRGRIQLDGVAFVERVHCAVTHQRGRGDLGQEIGDRRLDGAVVLQLHEPLAQLERATHVHGDASWKTGACQASVSRRAIVLRIEESCCTSTPSSGRAGARERG